MPRVSSAPEDAFHFKGGFADGYGKIISAKSLIFQFPPNKDSGQQGPPQLFCCLEIQRYNDGDGSKSAEQPSEVLLGIQGPNRQTGELDSCHPGKFVDGDVNSDPEDQGGELGAEGDTLYALQDGFQLNDKTKWMSFTASLVERGFKPTVLKRTYFPDLVGLYAYFTTVTKPKFRDDMDKEPTVFVVKDIKQFPYEAKKDTAAATKGKPAPATAKGKATPAPAATTKVAAPDSTDAPAESTIDVDEIAVAILTDTVAPSQKGVLMPDMLKVKITAIMAIGKHKPAVPVNLKPALQEKFKDLDWIAEIGEATGLFVKQADGKVQWD